MKLVIDDKPDKFLYRSVLPEWVMSYLVFSGFFFFFAGIVWIFSNWIKIWPALVVLSIIVLFGLGISYIAIPIYNYLMKMHVAKRYKLWLRNHHKLRGGTPPYDLGEGLIRQPMTRHAIPVVAHMYVSADLGSAMYQVEITDIVERNTQKKAATEAE